MAQPSDSSASSHDMWSHRAEAYDRLSRREPLFGTLARRLVEHVPGSLAGIPWMDLGAGAGLLAEQVLRTDRGSHAHLVEPVSAMRELARRRLAPYRDSFTIHEARAEDVGELGVRVQAVLSSAALHLASLEETFAGVSKCLASDGVFHFNLWGHSFDETVSEEPPHDAWRPTLALALEDIGRIDDMPPERTTPPRNVHSRASLGALAERNGFHPPEVHVDRDPVMRGLDLEFASMAPGFLAELSPEERSGVLESTRGALSEPRDYASVRVLLRRV